jgi:hypothetical protein
MDPTDLLRGLKPAGAREGLRDRVLAAARAAAASAPEPAPRWIDRIWESVPARWTWAATMGALLVGHWVLSMARLPPVLAPPRPPEERVALAADMTAGAWSWREGPPNDADSGSWSWSGNEGEGL